MGFPIVRVDRSLRAGPDAPREARQALRDLCGRVADERFDDLRLLVTELVTNSLRHGRLANGAAIDLGVVVAPGVVRVEVHDPGIGFQPSIVRKPLEDTQGWGLYLLGRIADRWGVVRERSAGPDTCVWFELDLGNP